MTDAPLVDAIIAIHDASRPLRRALESLLGAGLSVGNQLRITVVCHNVPRVDIESRLPDEVAGVVRFLELHDGVPSAAGPFTLGMAAATGRYVSIMGSDDWLEPGALRSWLALAEARGYTALIAPERHADGRRVRTPPVRPLRSGALDAVRDRLVYRTAPLGLLRRDAIERLGLAFPPGLRTGEDQFFSAKLWFSGEPIGYARRAPNYVVGADAEQRVTLAPRPVRDELRFVTQLVDGGWFRSIPLRERRAIATKLVRIHVFSVATRWGEAGADSTDRAGMRDLLALLDRRAPGFERPLARADLSLLAALRDEHTPSHVVSRLTIARRAFGSPATILCRDIRGQFAPDGPIRFMIASALL